MIVIPFLLLHLKDYCKFSSAQKDRRLIAYMLLQTKNDMLVATR